MSAALSSAGARSQGTLWGCRQNRIVSVLGHPQFSQGGSAATPFCPRSLPNSQLARHSELTLTPAVRDPLLAMRAAAIDRFLCAERRRFAVKGRSGTKPLPLLKHPIPIPPWGGMG